LKVDGGEGCVEPTVETIQSGEYTPLSRPLFMYPSTKALKRPEVNAFLDYLVENYQEIADASQIVAMSQEQADKAKAGLGG
jgi:phosphate transport system substrate-binding protein